MKTKAMIMTLCGAAILLMTLCGRNPGSGTETGNGVVAAMLRNPGGSPAKHATVYFYPVNYNPRTGGLGKTAVTIDSTTTDTNGNFTITLPADTYTMQASGDSGLAFQDSITAVKDSTVRPDPDTLKPAGSIRGVVRLEEGGDPRTIFILFMGTRTFTWPDDAAGNFTSGPMAAGHYRVRLITTTPDYLPLDDTLTVTAGENDTLADTIVLKYNGIPIPKNVRIVYDTLKQIVSLSWDSASASRVSSYNVYRRNFGLNTVLARINVNPITGTSYRDSSGVQDSTYEYQVAAVNAGASEGTKSVAMRVTVIAAFELIDTIGVDILQGYQRIKVGSNGIVYIVDIVDSNWNLHLFDSSYALLNTLNNTALKPPLSFDLDSLGNIYIINQNGIFKLDSSANLLDTFLTLSNAENKNITIGNGCLYIANDVLRKYSLKGDSLGFSDEVPQFRADGEILVHNNRLYATGIDNKVRIYDLSLNFVGEFALNFGQTVETRLITKDIQNNIFVSGYHFNPTLFSLLYLDSNLQYKGKLNLGNSGQTPYDIEFQNSNLLIGQDGFVKVYMRRG
jgi:hypothetical protein